MWYDFSFHQVVVFMRFSECFPVISGFSIDIHTWIQWHFPTFSECSLVGPIQLSLALAQTSSYATGQHSLPDINCVLFFIYSALVIVAAAGDEAAVFWLVEFCFHIPMHQSFQNVILMAKCNCALNLRM